MHYLRHMIKFILKRIFSGFTVLFGVTILVFVLFKLMPDPARLTMGQRADVASIEATRKAEYLDEPVPIQFLYYLNDLSPISVYEFTPEKQKEYRYTKLFSLGEKNAVVLKAPYLRRSYQTKRRVTEVLLTALPTTAILAFAAITIASILGIFFGIIAAIKQFSWMDNSILVTTVLGISQPSYFSGVILGLVFGYLLADYTGLSHTGSLFELSDSGDEVFQPKNLILPALALGIRPIAIITQLTRGSMIEVMSQDYIRTAKAKGVSYFNVLKKHALRNALNPVITAVSGWFAALLAGAFFIEVIFDIKGLGFETIKALQNLDFPVVMGSVIFTAAVFISVNIFVDVLYGIFDPRVSNK